MPSDINVMALSPLYHVGAVVKDVDQTTRLLSSIWGLGPWQSVEETLEKDWLEIISGEPCRLREARAKLGPTMFELIQPLEGRSIWAEFIRTRGEGIHHIAFSVSNWEGMASKLQQSGGRMVAGGIEAGMHSGYFKIESGARWGYFETDPGGIIVEFAEQLEDKPLFSLPNNKTATIPPPRHIGAVVKDTDKTTKFLSSVWGLGPWDTTEVSIDEENIVVGEPCRLREAHTRLGPLVLELIQPLKGRGPWSEFLETKGEGLQHIAFSVSNYDEMVSKVLEHGGRMVVDEIFEGVRDCYLETKPGAILIELAEPGIHDEQEKNLNPSTF